MEPGPPAQPDNNFTAGFLLGPWVGVFAYYRSTRCSKLQLVGLCADLYLQGILSVQVRMAVVLISPGGIIQAADVELLFVVRKER